MNPLSFFSHTLCRWCKMRRTGKDTHKSFSLSRSVKYTHTHTHTHTHTQRTKAKKTKTVISSMCTFLPYFQTASVPLPLPFPSSFFSLSPPSLCQTFHSAITSLSECNVSTRAYNGTCSIWLFSASTFFFRNRVYLSVFAIHLDGWEKSF